MPDAPVIITPAFTPPSPSAPVVVISAFSAGSPSAPAVVTGAFSAGSPTAPRAITSAFSAGSPSNPAAVAAAWSQPDGPVNGCVQSNEDLYPGAVITFSILGSLNGYPVYRSGTGDENTGYQAIIRAEVGNALTNFEWCYQILSGGVLQAFWREIHPSDDTTPSPMLVTNWEAQGLGTEIEEGLPVFTPTYGPLAAPAVVKGAFSAGTPTAPRAITSAFSAGSPSAPVVIRGAYTPPNPSAPPAITT